MATDWDAALEKMGINNGAISEEAVVDAMEKLIEQKTDAVQTSEKTLEEMNLKELHEKEDEIDDDEERLFLELRKKRIAELKELQSKCKFGDVINISKLDYVQQVTESSKDSVVIVHIYTHSVLHCKLINQHLPVLAKKFPAIKFCRGEAATTVENYPESRCPTMFCYKDGQLLAQLIGSMYFGKVEELSCDALEWILSQHDMLSTELEEDPRDAATTKSNGIFSSKRRQIVQDEDSDDDY